VEVDETYCRYFVQLWAEAVIRQVRRVREIRAKFNQQFRAIERMDDGPDVLDLQETSRGVWAEQHALVWAAHQVERWARRLALERGDDPPPRDQVLADVRNALEHLDEAWFEGNHAIPGERSRSLEALPDSRLEVITSGGGLAFGLIDVEDLERCALSIVRSVEDEFMAEAEDWWSEMNSGR
jgi:hypothetical protein